MSIFLILYRIRIFLIYPLQQNEKFSDFNSIIRKSEIDNPWFTEENQKYALNKWTTLLNEENLNEWLQDYHFSETPKKIGLVLAGNIPLMGFHDVICTILSGNIAVIKPLSKDKIMIPFLLKKWNEFSKPLPIPFEIVEKLTDYDAVIATGSNNTARYLEYYFKKFFLHIKYTFLSQWLHYQYL